jgi:ABC-type sugar transport system ATPase subunit
MYAIEMNNVSKFYGRKRIAENLNLQISDAVFAVIFGAPATGKSTLLRLITGLENPSKGEIFIRGKNVSHVKPGERNIGYVPQSFALYPHYTVFDNIAYPLTLMAVPRTEIQPIVESAAAQLKITHLLKKMPNQCSGGEKQRVAIARGIVKDTKIFILDDPLTGLDFKLRERLFDDLRQMQADLDATFVYTTSDPLEALMLAEEIHVFGDGRILEAGKLEHVYEQPQHISTMRLLGYPNANILSGHVYPNGTSPVCRTELFEFHSQFSENVYQDSEVYVAVRPQHIQINPAKSDGLIQFDAEITLIEDLGGELLVYLESCNNILEAIVQHNAVKGLSEGPARIGLAPSNIALYALETEQHIGKGVF